MPRSLLVPDAVRDRLSRGSWPGRARFLAAGIVLVVLVVLVGVVGVVGAALAGCTTTAPADPTPAPTSAGPTVAASPVPTPSATTTPKPERPTAMDTIDVNGAIATATYFLSLYGYAPETGDLTDWDSLSHPECTFCSGVSTEVRRMVSLGQHQVWTGITVSSTSGVEVTKGTFFSVDVVGAQGAWTVVDKDGNVIEQDLAVKPVIFHMVIVRESGTWLVRAGQPERTDG
jgi:hypothetical protein